MGQMRTLPPVLLVAACFSRHADARGWARQRLEGAFGPVGLASDPFDFGHTPYYAPTMGDGLVKELWAFARPVDLGQLPAIKRATNALEEEAAALGRWPEARPVNIDPGYLEPGKLVLATTKDQAHRLHIGDGVFGEVTLHWRGGAWQPWPWTYADYREPVVLAFLAQAREWQRRLDVRPSGAV